MSLARGARDARRRKNGVKGKRGNRNGNRKQRKKQRKMSKGGKRMNIHRKKSARGSKVRSSTRQTAKPGLYTGQPCSYIIFDNIITNGAGCKTGK